MSENGSCTTQGDHAVGIDIGDEDLLLSCDPMFSPNVMILLRAGLLSIFMMALPVVLLIAAIFVIVS